MEAQQEEFTSIENGELKIENGFSGRVEGVPKGFERWVSENRHRIEKAKYLPDFLRENPRYAPEFTNLTKYTAIEKIFVRHRTTQIAIDRMSTSFFKKAYPQLSNIELAAIHHYTRSKVYANPLTRPYQILNNQLRAGKIDEFNSAFASLIGSGLSKLPNEKGIVYRGSILKQSVIDDYIKAFKTKKPYQHNFITSASKEASIADDFNGIRRLFKTESKVLFEIEGKNFKYLGDISEFNGKFAKQNQKEVIFNIGAKFEIINYTIIDDVYYFKMKEL